MPFPPLVVTGQVVSAAHINSIRNALSTWPGDVSADGYNLNELGGLFFNDDPDTGIQRPSADVLQIVTGGAVRLQADTALHAIGSGQLSSGAPSGLSTFSVIANVAGDTDRRMMFGIDEVNAIGWIQVYDLGAIPYALHLNPQGGRVVISGGRLNFAAGLATYADDAAAGAGGLGAGDLYSTSTGEVRRKL